MNYLSPIIFSRLNSKCKKLNNLRPLPQSAVRKLREKFQVEMTYNSNAIEGNSLTLQETYLVINEGITVRGKPLRDHLEAKDHYAALEYVYSLIEHDKKNTISESLIRTLHKLIVSDTEAEWAGKYRNAGVIIGGSTHIPPDAIEVSKQMHSLMLWLRTHSLQNKAQSLNPVELAAIIHHKLVYIHPFFDGNGRTARLVMNILLMQAGYPLVVILKNDRKKYYSVLSRADRNDYKPLVTFIAQAVERSLDMYLKTLSPSEYPQEQFIPLSQASKLTSFSAKYLNLLVRQGKLEAYKEGRNWLTSKEAIERYLKDRLRQR